MDPVASHNQQEEREQEDRKKKAQARKKRKQEKKLRAFTFINDTIPDHWNTLIELNKSNTTVNKPIYNKSVLEAKNALLTIASQENIQIDEREFLTLTFQRILTPNLVVRFRPKTKMSLYEIRETAAHTFEQFRTLAWPPKKENGAYLDVFKQAITIITSNPANKIDEKIKLELQNVFYVIDKKTSFLFNEIDACQLLLYAVIISIVSQKDDESAAEAEAEEVTAEQPKQSTYGMLKGLFTPKKTDSNVHGGKKSRAKKRRNRKTSRRCK